MLENLKLGFIILLTGIVIVFTVLVLLIGIIKLYSSLVSSVQNSIENKKSKKAETVKKEAVAPEPKPTKAPEEKTEQVVDDSAVPLEVIAAIAAAVEVVFGQGAVKIKSVRKSSKRRSAWKSAGVAENTRSF